jgi:integrase
MTMLYALSIQLQSNERKFNRAMIERSKLTRPLFNQTQQILPPQKTQKPATTPPVQWPLKRQVPETTESLPADSAELWGKIQGILPDTRSQRLAYLLYHCGLRPREIINACGQEFNDLQEIYRLRYHIIEILLHNKIIPE